MPGVQRATYWETAVDSQGRAVREDVRQAAKIMWKIVCSKARAVLGDDVEAADILERCVGRVSRYLDTRGAALFTENVNALLFVSLRRELWSVRRRCRTHVDINQCADQLRDSTWSETVESQLDLQNFIRQLSDRNRTVLYLRRAGYGWKEVAALLGTTVPEVKNSFWRELVRLRSKFATLRSEDHDSCQAPKKGPSCTSVPNDRGRQLLKIALAGYLSDFLPRMNLKSPPISRPM